MADTLQRIQQSYGDSENPNKEPICRDSIIQWMEEKDINALGALYACLLKPGYAKRIVPPLEFREYKNFLLAYYRRCFLEDNISDDPESYLMSRYGAGRDMANWILSLQADKRINKKELDGTMTEIRNMLETLYVKGDEELRDCLVTATLEHIFTHKKIMHHFKSWKSDAVLGEAYRLSCMYSEKLNNAD